MKRLIIPLAIILLFISSTCVWAGSEKTIILKDGSQLKGKVLSLQEGVYVIKTSNLGTLSVKSSNIVTITSKAPAAPDEQKPASSNPNLQNQIQQMQGQVMTDPNLLSDINSLTSDEDIMAIMKDPDLMKAVLSYDLEAIKNNASVQELLQNPKMQQLINKIDQKVGVGQ